MAGVRGVSQNHPISGQYKVRIGMVVQLIEKLWGRDRIWNWTQEDDPATGRPWHIKPSTFDDYITRANRIIRAKGGVQSQEIKVEEMKLLSPKEFRADLMIDHDGKAVKFCPDPWQVEDFDSLDDAWEVVAGLRKDVARTRSSWQERPRGHSKTSDLAVMAAWALQYAVNPIKGIAAAAAQQQAGLMKDAMERLIRFNKCLGALKIRQWEVINQNTGSSLAIMATDVSTSWGQLPDFVIADEVCHWVEGKGEGFWESLFSSADKRGHCLMVVITNAGFMESWVWKVRELVRVDPTWHFSHLDGPKASWITPDRLERQKRILPPLVYDRLWNNVWSTGTGDAITEADIQASLVREGPLQGREEGWIYYGGVDLSVSRDDAAVVIVGRRMGVLRLARCQAWKPPKGGKIDFALIRQTIIDLHGIFQPHYLIDQYQAELLSGELTRAGISSEIVQFGAKSATEMASSMIEAFSGRSIELYHDAMLINDLRRLRIKSSITGYKLDAPRTGEGHVDRATALSLAVLGARRAGNFFWGVTLEKPQPTINDMAPQGVYINGGIEQDDSFRVLHPMDDDDFVMGLDQWGPPGGV